MRISGVEPGMLWIFVRRGAGAESTVHAPLVSRRQMDRQGQPGN